MNSISKHYLIRFNPLSTSDTRNEVVNLIFDKFEWLRGRQDPERGMLILKENEANEINSFLKGEGIEVVLIPSNQKYDDDTYEEVDVDSGPFIRTPGFSVDAIKSSVNGIEIAVKKGFLSDEQVADILSDISILNRLNGGDGINFELVSQIIPEYVEA